MKAQVNCTIDVECKFFIEKNKLKPSHILNNEIKKLMEAQK